MSDSATATPATIPAQRRGLNDANGAPGDLRRAIDIAGVR